MPPVLVRMDRVVLGYRSPLLEPLSLVLREGGFLAVVGPNGGGKSTLVRTLCGVVSPLGGRVLWPKGRVRLGYVPQRQHIDDLFPIAAGEVVALGLLAVRRGWRGIRPADRDRARGWLARLGIGHLADVPFRELSGGQRQRVLLARALAVEPRLLILDEPTSALDPVAEQRFLEDVLGERRRSGTSVVLVTHDLERAAMAEHVALLDKDRGMFVCERSEVFFQTERLRRLYGVPVKVSRDQEGVRIRFLVEQAIHG